MFRPPRAKQGMAAVTTSWLFICFLASKEEVVGQRATIFSERHSQIAFSSYRIRYMQDKPDKPELFFPPLKQHYWNTCLCYLQPLSKESWGTPQIIQVFFLMPKYVATPKKDWARASRSCWQANTVASGPRGKCQMCPIYHRDRWEVEDRLRNPMGPSVSLSSRFLRDIVCVCVCQMFD